MSKYMENEIKRLKDINAELLEACKRALEWGESEIHSEYNGTIMLYERLAELDFLHTAIAKADGK